ncbi:MAG: nucleotidyltransferase [Acidobacteria bacterium]|nr:MAG: nucleotidyltransferase [Acidobacteriota bacterium]
MKAMILAAGLGTRLRPLTDARPKALVELAGRTLLEITLSRLRAFGVSEVIVNVHHFVDMVIDYLKSNNNFGMRIEISREDVLLDTGGGLKRAAWFFLEDSARRDSSQDEPFLLHNVDVISNIDLRRMLQFHTENHAMATLAVQSRETSRYLLFDDHQLCGRRTGRDGTPEWVRGHLPDSLRGGTVSAVPNKIGNSEALAPAVPLQALAFTGIHTMSPRLLPMLTEEGVFSIIPSYLRLADQGEKILAFRADDYYWRDLGRPADLAQAARDLQQNVLL